MRLAVLILMIGVVGLAAQEKKTENRSAAPPKNVVQVTEIPAGAKELEPGRYRYTDAKGHTWTYVRGPFGIEKIREQVAEKPKPPAEMKAFEEGENVRFQRKTPFGVMRWVRKKSELNEVERAVWERDRPEKDKDATDQK